MVFFVCVFYCQPCLPVGVPYVVEVVARGGVDAVLDKAGEVAFPGAGVVAFERVGAGVLPTDHVPVVGPDRLDKMYNNYR